MLKVAGQQDTTNAILEELEQVRVVSLLVRTMVGAKLEENELK